MDDNNTTGRRVSGRTKVKSGCRTCKIRKVKCDEGRPACRRCVSTGRVCDGYGIWGGGGSPYVAQRQRQTHNPPERRIVPVPRTPATVSVLMPSSEEQGYFEWFRCRTAGKLPGSFLSSFWDTLLFQASVDEPAVLHAVLALSSVHKQGITNTEVVQTGAGVPHRQERFTLQQYVKAISQLQPHFSAKDRASFRVALIACVVFVALELLRGHFKAAQLHLQKGLEIMGQMKALFDADDGVLSIKASHEINDDWIVEALSRLNLQVELFRHAYRHPCQVLQVQDTTPQNEILAFRSFKDAWNRIDRLFNRVFYLSGKSRQREMLQRQSANDPQLAFLEQQQRQIRIELVQWLSMFQEFIKSTRYQQSTDDEKEKRYNVLCPYHTMASIMLETCLQPDDEMIFDDHTDKFTLIVNQSLDLWVAPSTPSPPSVPPGLIMDMSRSIIDVGWIPPLYYAATKCRVHRVRLHAIKLLEAAAHREGFWDSKIASLVARKVMQLEERDFYKDFDLDDDFPFDSPPRFVNLDVPTLLDSHRLREVEVVLLGAPMDQIKLFTKQKRQGQLSRVLAGAYKAQAESWVEGPDTSKLVSD